MTTYLGKSCSFCLPRVPFVNCRQFMYLVISLLVLRAGYGIWLYQFLIIAYLFTLHYEALHESLVLPCFLSMCFSVLLAFWSPCLGKTELVFVLIVRLFVSYAHVNLYHIFSSSWCQGLAVASACGFSWTFLFTFLETHDVRVQTFFTIILNFISVACHILSLSSNPA